MEAVHTVTLPMARENDEWGLFGGLLCWLVAAAVAVGLTVLLIQLSRNYPPKLFLYIGVCAWPGMHLVPYLWVGVARLSTAAQGVSWDLGGSLCWFVSSLFAVPVQYIAALLSGVWWRSIAFLQLGFAVALFESLDAANLDFPGAQRGASDERVEHEAMGAYRPTGPGITMRIADIHSS